jgi:hypothetical protein
MKADARPPVHQTKVSTGRKRTEVFNITRSTRRPIQASGHGVISQQVANLGLPRPTSNDGSTSRATSAARRRISGKLSDIFDLSRLGRGTIQALDLACLSQSCDRSRPRPLTGCSDGALSVGRGRTRRRAAQLLLPLARQGPLKFPRIPAHSTTLRLQNEGYLYPRVPVFSSPHRHGRLGCPFPRSRGGSH